MADRDIERSADGGVTVETTATNSTSAQQRVNRAIATEEAEFRAHLDERARVEIERGKRVAHLRDALEALKTAAFPSAIDAWATGGIDNIAMLIELEVSSLEDAGAAREGEELLAVKHRLLARDGLKSTKVAEILASNPRAEAATARKACLVAVTELARVEDEIKQDAWLDEPEMRAIASEVTLACDRKREGRKGRDVVLVSDGREEREVIGERAGLKKQQAGLAKHRRRHRGRASVPRKRRG